MAAWLQFVQFAGRSRQKMNGVVVAIVVVVSETFEPFVSFVTFTGVVVTFVAFGTYPPRPTSSLRGQVGKEPSGGTGETPKRI